MHCRDKLHKEYASGTQAIERAHAQAQAQMEDRLVEDQAGVIANLWRILSWAGISPQQVAFGKHVHPKPCIQRMMAL